MPAVCSSSPDSVAKRLDLDVSRQNILSLVELHVQPTKLTTNTPTDCCSLYAQCSPKNSRVENVVDEFVGLSSTFVLNSTNL